MKNRAKSLLAHSKLESGAGLFLSQLFYDERHRVQNDERFLQSAAFTHETVSVRAANFLTSQKSSLSTGSNFFVGEDVECRSEDVLEAPADEEVTKKGTFLRPSDPLTYTRQKVWRTVLPANSVQNSLRAILKKHEDDLLKFLGVSKSWYGAELMTSVEPVSVEVGIVSVYSML